MVFHSRGMVTTIKRVYLYIPLSLLALRQEIVTFFYIKIAGLNYSHLVTTILQQQHNCELFQL